MLASIDRYTLSVAESFAHSIQRNFGIKPISIALAGDILFACSLISWWFIPGVTISTAGKIFDTFLFLLIFWETIVIYPYIEKEMERNVADGLSNRRKMDPIHQILRVTILTMFALSLTAFFNDMSLKNLNGSLQVFGLLLALYFIACDPLPPAPSRFRKLIESTFGHNQVVQD